MFSFYEVLYKNIVFLFESKNVMKSRPSLIHIFAFFMLSVVARTKGKKKRKFFTLWYQDLKKNSLSRQTKVKYSYDCNLICY